MKLSVSNIGWKELQDNSMYSVMKMYGFTGLEIAPTRVFAGTPYDRLSEAAFWAEGIKMKYGFQISSMQSIWYGRNEKLFGSESERKILIAYTKKAIDFAAAIGCKNLVFGCPRNRVLTTAADEFKGIQFFREIGDYAAQMGTVFGIEANPVIYHTNYINETDTSLALVKKIQSKGIKLNLDVGTMVQNEESIDILKDNINCINHIHISEPGLKPIKKRELHKELKYMLMKEGYSGFVSVEMADANEPEKLAACMEYAADVFG